MAHTELVIFDFDGTLIDTAPDIIRAVNRYLKLKGFAPRSDQQIRDEIGMGLKNLILDIYPEEHSNVNFQQTIYREFTEIYEQEFLVSPRLFDGALDFLTEWPGQVAIVSNKRMRFIEPILRKLKLDELEWVSIIGGDTFSNMKPHPEPFLAALEAANTSAQNTLIVGDGTPDVEGAIAIGSRCVAVEFGYTSYEELMALGAWRSLPAYSHLRPLIDSLGGKQ